MQASVTSEKYSMKTEIFFIKSQILTSHLELLCKYAFVERHCFRFNLMDFVCRVT